MLKPILRNLVKKRMGNLELRAKEAFEELCQKQEVNLNNPSPEAMEEENEAFIRWERVASLEEKYFKAEVKTALVKDW